MKKVLPLILVAALASGCSLPCRPRVIPARHLGDRSKILVTGSLGPICHLRTIRATVVDGATLRNKATMSDFLLLVHKVDGRDLTPPVTLPFRDRTYELPADQFDRHEQLHGKATGVIGSADAPLLKQGYVGTTRDLLVYETGRFGQFHPDEDPKGMYLGQGAGYYFETEVVVIKILKQIAKDEKPNVSVILDSSRDAKRRGLNRSRPHSCWVNKDS